jgi:hypothetical protein
MGPQVATGACGHQQHIRIDSLVAIDLKNWFTREKGAAEQVFVLFGKKVVGRGRARVISA